MRRRAPRIYPVRADRRRGPDRGPGGPGDPVHREHVRRLQASGRGGSGRRQVGADADAGDPGRPALPLRRRRQRLRFPRGAGRLAVLGRRRPAGPVGRRRRRRWSCRNRCRAASSSPRRTRPDANPYDALNPPPSSSSGAWNTVAVFLPDGTAQQDVEIVFRMADCSPVSLRLRALTGGVTSRRLRRGRFAVTTHDRVLDQSLSPARARARPPDAVRLADLGLTPRSGWCRRPALTLLEVLVALAIFLLAMVVFGEMIVRNGQTRPRRAAPEPGDAAVQIQAERGHFRRRAA